MTSTDGANLPHFQRLQFDFAAHIRHPERHPLPEGIEPRRMQIYVDLFYANVEKFLAGTFPVTHQVLPEDHWHAMARDFLHRHRSTSPFFLEIPREFIAYLESERDCADDPPWLMELCHYEWVELALDVAETELPLDRADADGDLLAGRPLVSPLAQTLGYRWPVHEIGPKHQPDSAPEEPTWLVVHRDRGDTVRFMVANSVTVRLLDLLRSEPVPTGEDALRVLAEELGRPRDSLLESGARLLEDLRSRDILLGTLTGA